MDNTALFRACVKAMRLRKKLQTKREIIEERVSCPFVNQGKQIVKSVSELCDLLLSTRREYINSNRLFASATALTDNERDQIDLQTEAAIKGCNQLIRNLKQTVRLEECAPQRYRHRQAMVEIVESYLKAVCKLYSEQKAVRVKKAADMKRMARLSSLISPKTEKKIVEEQKPNTSSQETHQESSIPLTDGLRRRTNVQVDKIPEPDVDKSSQKTRVSAIFEETTAVKEEDLNEQERMQLTKENDQIYHRMNSIVDEIQQLEGRVVEIAHLQQVFTEKVLEQEQDIYRINEVAIHTTENVKYGNEQIREAMKRKSGMRVYILFFLLVLTFTLLFLDWYNA